MNLSGKIFFIIEMFVIITAVYILSFFVIGCTNQNNFKKETAVFGNNFIVKDGLIYKNDNHNPYSGKIVDTVKSRVIEYDVVNGKKNGDFIIRYENGIIQIKGTMKENKNNGLWKYYYPTGQLESQGNFKDDKVNNKWTWYYKNGNVKETGVFIDGKREGNWSMYGKDGSLNTILTFRNGKIINKQSAGEVRTI